MRKLSGIFFITVRIEEKSSSTDAVTVTVVYWVVCGLGERSKYRSRLTHFDQETRKNISFNILSSSQWSCLWPLKVSLNCRSNSTLNCKVRHYLIHSLPRLPFSAYIKLYLYLKLNYYIPNMYWKCPWNETFP